MDSTEITPPQRLSIIIMDDAGRTRRFRYSTWRVRAFCGVILLLPIIVAIASYSALDSWRIIDLLEKEKQEIQQTLHESEQKIERLARLQALLESNMQPIIIKPSTQGSASDNAQVSGITQAPPLAPPYDIDAHKKILTSNRLELKNVHIRRITGNKLRITLDLENSNAAEMLAGNIRFSFLFPDGTLVPLKTDDYSFRVRRFKEMDNTIPLNKKTLDEIDSILVVAEVYLDKIVQHRAYYPIPTP